MEQELLAHDRRVRLDHERLALDPQRAARAVGGGRPLRHDRVERREEAGPPELVLEAQPRRGPRDQVADPGHRAPAPAWLVASSPRRRPSCRRSAGPGVRRGAAVGLGARPPRASRSRAAPGRGRPGSSSSRTPGAAPRSGGRGGPAGPGRARRRRRRGAGAAGARRGSVTRSSSASLSARIAVRCWPREANAARSRPPMTNATSSRCGPIERRAVPELLLRRLAEPPRERVAGRLVGPGRRVRHVLEPELRRPPPPRARSRRGPRRAGGASRARSAWRAATTAPPASRNGWSQ